MITPTPSKIRAVIFALAMTLANLGMLLWAKNIAWSPGAGVGGSGFAVPLRESLSGNPLNLSYPLIFYVILPGSYWFNHELLQKVCQSWTSKPRVLIETEIFFIVLTLGINLFFIV